MADLFLNKLPGGQLVAGDEEAAEAIRKLPLGKLLRCKVTRVRNERFLRKWFAMARAGFDAWDPPYAEWRGHVAEKDFERFRKDITIAAGYFHTVVNIRGEVRVEADSLSFDRMDEDTFEKCYGATFNVISKMLMAQSSHWTREEFARVCAAHEGFA